MQRLSAAPLLLLLLLRCALGPAAAALMLPLRLVQFADLHLGEAEGLAWGPEQDRNSTRVMQQVLAAELPGLVVYSGDQITGNNVGENATAYSRMAFAPAAAANVPFASLFGNHDTAPLEKGKVAPPQWRLSSTTRQQLLAFERAAFPALSLTCGEAALRGCPPALAPAASNYALVLRNASGAPRAVLYFLDSGGGDYAETLPAAVTDWLAATARGIGPALPSVVFVHIPPPEYVAAAGGARCVGLAQDGVTPTQAGANALLATLLAALGGGAQCPWGTTTATPGAAPAPPATSACATGGTAGTAGTASGAGARACLSWQRTPARATAWQ